jgi:hypothetical protein
MCSSGVAPSHETSEYPRDACVASARRPGSRDLTASSTLSTLSTSVMPTRAPADTANAAAGESWATCAVSRDRRASLA